jgi:hypothetical protein
MHLMCEMRLRPVIFLGTSMAMVKRTSLLCALGPTRSPAHIELGLFYLRPPSSLLIPFCRAAVFKYVDPVAFPAAFPFTSYQSSSKPL